MVNSLLRSMKSVFLSQKLRVNNGILDVYLVTSGVVKVAVGFLCKVVNILSCLI